MNLHWLSSVLDPLFVWTWRTSLAAVVLIALVWLLQQTLRKWLPVRWLYALWLCVLVRLILPVVPSATFSLFNVAHLTKIESPTAVREFSNVAPIAVQGDPSAVKLLESNSLIGAEIPAPKRNQWLALAPYIWISGVLLYLAIIFAYHRRFYRWLRRQQPTMDARLIGLVAEAKSQLNIREDVRVFEVNGAPSLFGAFKPHLLLPKSALEKLTDAELRHIILHELIHFKRRDVLMNWLIIVVQALHWFNPSVWMAMRRLRAARELACDAAVLVRLSSDDRKAYGTTLIKIIDSCSKISPTPSLVPILNRKKQMHRRISMIANYKPTTRLVAAGSALLVIALGCLTFTRATDKPTVAPVAFGNASSVNQVNSNETRTAERIAMLEKFIVTQDESIRMQQERLDALKREMAISDLEEAGGASSNAEAIRKLETLRLDAKAEYEKVNALYTHLANLNRTEFRRAVATASPDAQLATLQDQFSAAEQKLSILTEQFSADHPEVRSVRRMLELIQKQIDDRLDGILYGLKARTTSYKTSLARLEQEIGSMKKSEIETAIAKRPYFQTKRTLEAMQSARDQAYQRLMQAKIDAMIPK